jgi:hypothetical protein
VKELLYIRARNTKVRAEFTNIKFGIGIAFDHIFFDLLEKLIFAKAISFAKPEENVKN